MIKQHKGKAIVSSLLILLPMAAGLLFWNDLPEKMATHWGIGGAADGWTSRPFAVFGLPLFILAIHWLCLGFTAMDKKNKGTNKKALSLVFWLCPVISLFGNGAIYASAFGWAFRMDALAPLLLGLLFLVIGNYLPKVSQNHTLGIRIKWTLENEENWNATHRFAGRVWMIGGLLMMACIFLPTAALPFALFILLPLLVLVPVIYSYRHYKTHA